MERDVWLIGAGVFGLLAGLWAIVYYEPYAAIWPFSAAVAAMGFGSLVAGGLQRAGVY